MKIKGRILVAPLNWGLGHATRCMPIIEALEANQFEPVLASDGAALELLRKEYPNLQSIELPSYNVKYARNGRHFKSALMASVPGIAEAIKQERRTVRNLVSSEKIDGIISDNRLGVYAKGIRQVFITHQLNVLSGFTTELTSAIHRKYIHKFDACWVPDFESVNNLSGALGHSDKIKIPTHFLGPLSRFRYKAVAKQFDLLVLLSGPEPQRSILEEKLLRELPEFQGEICVVRGVIEEKQTVEQSGHITLYNFMTSNLLEQTINASEMVLSRSGYTTIMDLAILRKKAFFIPTPGQYEQEYLAERLAKLGVVPFSTQKAFNIKMLEDMQNYSGFHREYPPSKLNRRLAFFERK